MLDKIAPELCLLEVEEKKDCCLISWQMMQVCQHAPSNKTGPSLHLSSFVSRSFLIRLLFQSVKCLIWKQISLFLFVSFWGKDVGLERHWWLSFAFAYNLMKSFLVALCSSSHSRCSLFVLLCCWPAWRRAAMLLTSMRFPLPVIPQRKCESVQRNFHLPTRLDLRIEQYEANGRHRLHCCNAAMQA